MSVETSLSDDLTDLGNDIRNLMADTRRARMAHLDNADPELKSLEDGLFLAGVRISMIVLELSATELSLAQMQRETKANLDASISLLKRMERQEALRGNLADKAQDPSFDFSVDHDANVTVVKKLPDAEASSKVVAFPTPLARAIHRQGRHGGRDGGSEGGTA